MKKHTLVPYGFAEFEIADARSKFKMKVAPQNKKAHFGTVRFRGI
jgi:hypothetical protein